QLKGGKEIYMGKTRDLLNVKTVQEQIVEGAKRMPNQTLKRAEWLGCVEGMLPFTEERDNPDISQEGLIGGWIPEYLEGAPHIKDTEASQMIYKGCLEGAEPFLQNGNAFVNLDHFRDFLLRRKNERRKRTELIDMFRRVKAEDKKLSLYVGEGKRMQRRYWVVPLPDTHV
ncbi:hypothetical protein LCGC14_3155830, partial [marine sediment metagenome]